MKGSHARLDRCRSHAGATGLWIFHDRNLVARLQKD